jgi:CheY-like chemotaxis protein
LPASETILIVEDDIHARNALREALETLGYQVWIAANGQEALTLLESAAAHVDLVVSDLVMPTLGGEELVQALARTYPSIPVIIVTGYPLDHGGKHLLERGAVDWVLKPFSIEDIVSRIRKGLEG